MTARARIIVGLVAGTLLLAMTMGVAFAARSVLQGGVISVDVKERNGNHVSVSLPAAVLRVGLWLVPDRLIAEAGREIHPWWPVVDKAADELGRLPDGIFVDVKGPDGTVWIGKKDDLFFVRVDSRDEVVKITVPLDAVQDVLRKLKHALPQGNDSIPLKTLYQAGLRPEPVSSPPTRVPATPI